MLSGIKYTESGRPYKRSLVKAKRKSGIVMYLRRVYGYVGRCKECGREFFTRWNFVKFCTISCSKKGIRNPQWTGGKQRSGGYIRILTPEGYILEQRLVMEKVLGRKLGNNEMVHHRNQIKTDNRKENLEIVIKKMHVGKVICPFCNQSFSVR